MRTEKRQVERCGINDILKIDWGALIVVDSLQKKNYGIYRIPHQHPLGPLRFSICLLHNSLPIVFTSHNGCCAVNTRRFQVTLYCSSQRSSRKEQVYHQRPIISGTTRRTVLYPHTATFIYCLYIHNCSFCMCFGGFFSPFFMRTQTVTHTHTNIDFLIHSKPHSGKEIFNFPTPVNMLFYLRCFDLQTDLSCALGDSVQRGDWVVGVFCFKECWQVMEHTSWPFHILSSCWKSLPHIGHH